MHCLQYSVSSKCPSEHYFSLIKWCMYMHVRLFQPQSYLLLHLLTAFNLSLLWRHSEVLRWASLCCSPLNWRSSPPLRVQLRGIEHVCQSSVRATIWGAGHGGLLLFNEHSDRFSSLCLSVRAWAVCAQPSVPPLRHQPARRGRASGGLTGLLQIQASGAYRWIPAQCGTMTAARKKPAQNVWEVY